MALLILLYNLWTNIKNLNKVKYAEIKFLRSVKGSSMLDEIENEAIVKEIVVEWIANIIIVTKHLLWKGVIRSPKAVLNYTPRGGEKKDPRDSGGMYEAGIDSNAQTREWRRRRELDELQLQIQCL